MSGITEQTIANIQILTGWSAQLIRNTQSRHEAGERAAANRRAVEERRAVVREAKRLTAPGFVGKFKPISASESEVNGMVVPPRRK